MSRGPGRLMVTGTEQGPDHALPTEDLCRVALPGVNRVDKMSALRAMWNVQACDAVQVLVPKQDYPSPALGDREVDDELGPLTVIGIVDHRDRWAIIYGAEWPAASDRQR